MTFDDLNSDFQCRGIKISFGNSESLKPKGWGPLVVMGHSAKCVYIYVGIVISVLIYIIVFYFVQYRFCVVLQ